jgi:hypothetical protein
MGQDVLREILHEIAAEAVPTPLADQALRGAVRRRRAKAWASAAAAAGVLIAAPFLLPGDGQGRPDQRVPASNVSVPPAPAGPLVTTAPGTPARTSDARSSPSVSGPESAYRPTTPPNTPSGGASSPAPTGSATPTDGVTGPATPPTAPTGSGGRLSSTVPTSTAPTVRTTTEATG